MSNICNELRISILQAALQGKLSKRLPEDGTAKDLLDEIYSRKTSINKKVKPLTDDDKLFTIPDTWEWIKFGEVVDFSMGKTPPRADASYWGKDIPWVSIADMSENDVLLSTKEKVSNKALKEKFNSKIVPKDTLIMSFKLTVGRCSILGIDAVHNEAIISIKPIIDKNSIFRDYLAMALPFLSNYGDTKEAIKGKTLNSDSLNNLSIPLPPLTEQKRIVEQVDKLMARVTDLEQLADTLASLKKTFPYDVKASLLQAAMQGKLTKQLPEDSSAEDLLEGIKAEKEKLIAEGKIKKQKSLAPITDDEIPFNIPDNWKWVRLRDICTKIADGDHNPPKGLTHESEYLMLSSQNINNDTLVNMSKVRYLDKNTFEKVNERTNLQKEDILFTSVGSLGRSCIFREDINACFQRSVSVLTTLVYNEYLKLFLDSPFIQNKVYKEAAGTAQKGFYLNQLEKCPIAIPPLSEQKRIVERLNVLIQNINMVGDLIASE